MRSLRLPNACLTELPPLSHLPLEEVDLQGNRLLGLEGLPMTIRTLNVSDNRIDQDGFFLPFPSLEDLNGSKNFLAIVDHDDFVLHFPSLKRLDLSKNRLRHVAFLRGSVVEELDVRENRLQVVNGLPPTLRTLIADSNEITMLQSKLPPSLERLDLGYNSLRSAGLPLTWSLCLRELHLDGNKLERFPQSLPDSVEVLTLNANRIQHGPSKLPQSLRILALDSNRLRTFVVPKGRRPLQMLLLSNNCLTELPSESVAGVLTTANNWTEELHATAQILIERAWRRTLMRLRLRTLVRTQRVRQELLQVSMNPDRWTQIDCLDPIWFRKGQDHNRTDRHSD